MGTIEILQKTLEDRHLHVMNCSVVCFTQFSHRSQVLVLFCCVGALVACGSRFYRKLRTVQVPKAISFVVHACKYEVYINANSIKGNFILND